jgi:chemotaxis response regulator CheB
LIICDGIGGRRLRAALLGILLTGANRMARPGWRSAGGRPDRGAVAAEAEQPTMPLEAIRLRAPDLILPLDDIHSLLLLLETVQDASPTKLLIVDDLPENLQALDA